MKKVLIVIMCLATVCCRPKTYTPYSDGSSDARRSGAPYMDEVCQTPFSYVYRYKDPKTGVMLFVVESSQSGNSTITAVK